MSTSPFTIDHLPAVAASHPAVRRYRAAQRGDLPRRERLVAVAGGWAHDVVLASDAAIEVLLWCPDDADELAALAAAAGRRAGAAYRISARTLDRLRPGRRPPGLLSLVGLPRRPAGEVLRSNHASLVLVADGVAYAGTLGTLIRTADASGAAAVVLTGETARPTHPQIFQASRGTVLTVPLLEYADAAEARRDLVAAGFVCYVAEPTASTAYVDGLVGDRIAVVVGSEHAGVGAGWRGHDLARVAIPMAGVADSLNVATSAAVLLFEARRHLDRSVLARPFGARH